MCTVTLFPLEDRGSFVLTSNRDEAPDRKTDPPKSYVENGVRMVYPKDASAGGTWLGVSEHKRVLCLLNGGFESHRRNPPYRKSRGLVAKELLAAENFIQAVESASFHDIEPFTVVAAECMVNPFFAELVWDGSTKHFRILPPGPYIWSSSPLYSNTMREIRKTWFQNLLDQGSVTEEELLNFHFTTGGEDHNIGVIMDRGMVKTTSVSQIICTEKKSFFYYKDLLKDQETKLTFHFSDKS